MLAAAAGTAVTRGPIEEVGFGDVELTAEGRQDPVLGPAGLAVEVFHWHHDTFALPPSAVRLARNSAYENQAFRIGDAAYGLQFHVEVDSDLLRTWQLHLPTGIPPSAWHPARGTDGGKSILERFFRLARYRSRPSR